MTDSPLPYPAEAIARLQDFQSGDTRFQAIGRDDEDLSALLDYAERAGDAMRWRPIESAPKDGTHILVGTFPTRPGDVTIATAHWFDSRDFGAKSGKAEWALSVNFDGEHSNHGVAAPTHWLPLPPAPDREG